MLRLLLQCCSICGLWSVAEPLYAVSRDEGVSGDCEFCVSEEIRLRPTLGGTWLLLLAMLLFSGCIPLLTGFAVLGNACVCAPLLPEHGLPSFTRTGTATRRGELADYILIQQKHISLKEYFFIQGRFREREREEDLRLLTWFCWFCSAMAFSFA